jgi:hypothetical protein
MGHAASVACDLWRSGSLKLPRRVPEFLLHERRCVSGEGRGRKGGTRDGGDGGVGVVQAAEVSPPCRAVD